MREVVPWYASTGTIPILGAICSSVVRTLSA